MALLNGILGLKSMRVIRPTSKHLRETLVKAMTINPQVVRMTSKSTAGTDTDLVGFVTIIQRNLRRIALATLGTLAVAVAYLAVATPVYTATATVLIDPRPRKTVSEEVVLGGLGSDLALVESQVPVISSDSVLKRAIIELAKDPATNFAPQNAPAASWLESFKTLIRGPRQTLDSNVAALEALQKGLIVKRAPKTYVVDIEVSTISPVQAAAAANAIAAAYLADQSAVKSDDSSRANKMIDARLGELTEQVRRGEIRIDDFKKANKILSSEGGNVNEQQLGKLSAELASARAVSAEAKARLEQANLILKGKSSADLLPEAMKSPLIQRLREQYAQVARREASLSTQLQSRHPVLIEVRSQIKEINAQISTELVRVSQSAKSESAVAQAREKELTRIIEGAKEDVGRTNTAQIKLREIEREVEAGRELLKAFLARAKETQEQTGMSTPEARVISEASVPLRPSKPGKLLILSLALLSGLGLGITQALLRDHLRRSPAEAAPQLEMTAALPEHRHVTRRTQLAVHNHNTSLQDLAHLPAPPQSRAQLPGATAAGSVSDLLLAMAHEKASAEPAFRQAIHRLLSRLQSGVGDGEPLTLLLGSPHRGAGTSAATLALGCAAARTGQRVLLVDAASIDAELSEVFAGELSQTEPVVLDSSEHLARIVKCDDVSGISVLPIAFADLRTLNSNQKRRLATGITSLAQAYDLVLIDGGALLDDDSALSLLPAVDRIAIVARIGMTTSDDIEALSALLRPDNDRLMGVTWTAA